jgi:hypothetical protein
VFWQGYLFSLGVGGSILSILYYLKPYIHDQYLFIGIEVLLVFLGAYGIIVGFFAGSIWRVQNRLSGHLKSTSIANILCASFLALPLVAYLFFILRMYFALDSIVYATIHFIFLTCFIMTGIRLGVSLGRGKS